jgi:S-adenosylmethionine:tRNA ribosyltransferase-isomerase
VNVDQLLSAYDYTLPIDRIAQQPAVPRDCSRLLVVPDRQQHSHEIFHALPDWLNAGDLLVFNDTRVIPARLYGQKVGGQGESGAAVEVLLLEAVAPDRWVALVKPGRRLHPGTEIRFPAAQPEQLPLRARILEKDAATNGRLLEFQVPGGVPLLSVLDQFGQVPLPPYITAGDSQPEQYQTVYAARPGAVAAPTAGLHFTPELLNRLTQKGIQQAFVTLHVGVGTFRPVEVEDITQHAMHGEWIDVPAATVALIHQTKAAGGRVIAVGTTAVRSLEAAAAVSPSGELQPYCGKTELFIYPGYTWRVIDGMITNFHLPKSSLMMMISALIGRERLLALYQTAIAEQYRFYSFGDAMLILPGARG